MGGTTGVAMGLTAGGTIGHMRGEQIGRMSIELVQMAALGRSHSYIGRPRELASSS